MSLWAWFWLAVSVLLGALSVPESFHRMLREGALVLAAISFLVFVSAAADALNAKIARHPPVHALFEEPKRIKRGVISLVAAVLLLVAWPIHRRYDPPAPAPSAPAPVVTAPAPLVTSTPAPTRSDVVVKPTSSIRPEFKASPLLTDARKAHITRDVNAFYDYLVGIGFEVPKKLPLIGVVRGNTSRAVYQEPGSFVEQSIFIPVARIDKPYAVVPQYAAWIFHVVFPWPESPQTRFNYDAHLLYATYYIASFTNEHTFDSASRLADWKNALWDLRTKYGKDVVDRLLFYSYASWYPPQPNTELDDFLWLRFHAGLHAIDNNQELMPGVLEIMKRRGLPRTSHGLKPESELHLVARRC